MAPLVLDHLWQSTVLALGLGLLALAFRKAPAAVRHGLWLSASAKFLVPFVALAALGRLVGPAIPLPAQAKPEAAFIAQAAQPFSRPAPLSKPPAQATLARRPDLPVPLSPASVASAPFAHGAAIRSAPRLDLGWVLLAAWALGSAAVLIAWAARWTRLRKVLRSARRLDWPAPMPVLAAPSLIEPGLVGLWRPILLVPETLPERLSRAEIDALLAHEACHRNRRDNLAAALHMLVEALFWFHPLVWWIGARMIEERERACDEAVVRAGHDRAAYARSLVEICRLYLQSPLDCVAGASGSNLKTRVEAIMTDPPVLPLSGAKKALLLATGACAVATPVAAGQLTTPEAQKVAAPLVRAVSAIAAPATARADAAARPEPPAPAVVARDTTVQAPAPSVAPMAAVPEPLTQDVAPPAVVPAETPAQPAVQADELKLASAPQPTRSSEIALAMSSDPSASVAFDHPKQQAFEAAGDDLKSQARSFVQANARISEFGYTVRWEEPLCLQVTGLTPEQNAAVVSRINAVAQTLAQKVYSGLHQMCGALTNVWVVFTPDPQRTLDGMVARDPRILGDAHSDTRGIETVTRPIQAWRETVCVWTACNPDPVAEPPLDARVLVDARRVDATRLGAIADYVAMLVLADPRAVDRCQVLPSVLDLFAGPCPGRPQPTGLTRSDLAYLKALYTAGNPITERDWNWSQHGGTADQIAGRMGMLLAGSGNLPSPGAKPERHD